VERTRLLIIDDWGPEPLTAEQRRDLLEIVDDRYERGSLLSSPPAFSPDRAVENSPV
jgi:DNA replication protein DnaC